MSGATDNNGSVPPRDEEEASSKTPTDDPKRATPPAEGASRDTEPENTNGKTEGSSEAAAANPQPTPEGTDDAPAPEADATNGEEAETTAASGREGKAEPAAEGKEAKDAATPIDTTEAKATPSDEQATAEEPAPKEAAKDEATSAPKEGRDTPKDGVEKKDGAKKTTFSESTEEAAADGQKKSRSPSPRDRRASSVDELHQSQMSQASTNQIITAACLDASTKAVEALEGGKLTALRNELTTLHVDEDRRLAAALEDVKWDTFGSHAFGVDYLVALLGLRMKPEDVLCDDTEPSYEPMLEVKKAVADLSAKSSNIPPFSDFLSKFSALLGELEMKFAASQVDVTALSVAPVIGTLKVVDSTMDKSVAHLVNEWREKITALVSEYQSVLDTQLERYNAEALAVDALSPARLRASSAAEEEDLWEARAARGGSETVSSKKALVDSISKVSPSANILKVIEAVEGEPVCAIEEEEWSLQRRASVERLKPRASLLIREKDADQFHDSVGVLTKIVEACRSKIDVMGKAADESRESKEKTEAVLREFSDNIEKNVADFTAQISEKGVATQKDYQTLVDYVKTEKKTHETKLAEFAVSLEAMKSGVASTQDTIDATWAEVVRLEEKLQQLARKKRDQVTTLLEKHREELQRQSKFQHVMETCDHHVALLKATVDNVELANASYPAMLKELTSAAGGVVKAVLDAQDGTLVSSLQQGYNDLANYSATLYHAVRVFAHRKEEKAADLAQKADTARKQLNFCKTTNDPLVTRHTTTAQEIDQLRDAIMQEVADVLVPQYDAARDTFTRVKEFVKNGEDGAPVIPFATPEELVQKSLDEDEEFVLRAPRPPLTNLNFTSTRRVLVPKKYFFDRTEERAMAQMQPPTPAAVANSDRKGSSSTNATPRDGDNAKAAPGDGTATNDGGGGDGAKEGDASAPPPREGDPPPEEAGRPTSAARNPLARPSSAGRRTPNGTAAQPKANGSPSSQSKW